MNRKRGRRDDEYVHQNMELDEIEPVKPIIPRRVKRQENITGYSDAQLNYIKLMQPKFLRLSDGQKIELINLLKDQFIQYGLLASPDATILNRALENRDWQAASEIIYKYPTWFLSPDRWWTLKSENNPYEMPLPYLQKSYKEVAGEDRECHLQYPPNPQKGITEWRNNQCYVCNFNLGGSLVENGLPVDFRKVESMTCTPIPLDSKPGESNFKNPYFKFRNPDCNYVCNLLNKNRKSTYIFKNGQPTDLSGGFPRFLSRGLNTYNINSINESQDKTIAFESRLDIDKIKEESVSVMDHVWHGSDSSKRYVNDTNFISTSKNLALTTFKYSNVMQVPQITKIAINVGLGEALDNPKAYN